MALITRITRLFTADFHAVLERLEEPEILLKQALREMEEDLIRSEQNIKRLQHDYEQLSARSAAARATLQNIDEELDICFASGEQALARSTTRRKLEAERLSHRIASKLESTQLARTEQQHLLAENHRQLESMRQKAELLCEQTPAHTSFTRNNNGRIDGDFSITENEVEVAYLKEKQRRNRP